MDILMEIKLIEDYILELKQEIKELEKDKKKLIDEKNEM